MTADAIKNQLNEIKEANMFDEDLRVFFTKHQMVGVQDIAYMLRYFEPKIDSDFSDDNIVFIPLPWILKSINKDKDGSQF
jgi:hypothetical protein